MNVNLSTFDAGALSAERIRAMLTLLPSVPDGLHTTSAQVRKAIEELPYIQEDELVAMGEKDNACPICIVPFLALIAEEEMARAMDSPAHPVEELGVTRLVGDGRCGHVFCRKDLSKWILSGKNTCPLCRQPLFKPETTPSPAAAGPPPAPAPSGSDSPANIGATNPNSDNTAGIGPNPNPNGDSQGALEATLGEHLARFQQLLGQALEDEGVPAPTTVPTPGVNADPPPHPTTVDGSTDAPQAQAQATESRNADPTARVRGSGRIGRDLGEGPADDNAEEFEEDEVLARLTAGMSPQEAQRFRSTMAQMQGMFSGSLPLDEMFGFARPGQTRRDERDDDRDQFSGMYS